jgi:ankyrin repeat protein
MTRARGEYEAQKPRVDVFLGRDVKRHVHTLPELEEELARRSLNRKVTGDGLEYIKSEQVSAEPCDIVSLYAHGNASIYGRSREEGKSKIAHYGLFDKQDTDEIYTAANLLYIQQRKHNKHFDIIGCFQGAVVDDINRDIDKFERGTTFTIQAPAQYSTSVDRSAPIMLDQLRQYEAGNRDTAGLFAKYTKQTAETIYFVKVVDGEGGKNTMIAFKAIAPKYAVDAQNLESFMGRESVRQPKGKEHQHTNLITIAGHDHPEYQTLHDHIIEARNATPIKEDYLHNALDVARLRDEARRKDEKEKTKHSKEKEDLVLELLKLYEHDIPNNIAKSYDGIAIKDGASEFIRGWYSHYNGGITEYAMTRNKSIDDKHPLAWATQNDIKINGKPAIAWAIEKDKMMGAEQALAWAIRTGQQIEGKSALEFAMEKGKELGDRSAIEWAIENDVMIGGKSVVEWAIDKKLSIGKLTPLEYAVANDLTIYGQSALDWMMDHENSRPIIEHKTLQKHVLEYKNADDGHEVKGARDTWRIEIPEGHSVADMYKDAFGTNATIDGVPAATWGLNYHNLYTHRTIFGQGAVEYAIKHGKKIKGFDTIDVPQLYDIRAIETAIKNRDQDALKASLTIDPNAHDELGNSPLSWAMVMENPKAVKRLIDLGADPNIADKSGKTAFFNAVLLGKIDIARAMLPKADPNIPNNFGDTPLFIASSSLKKDDSASMLELLLQNGADPNRPTAKGDLPLEYAIITGNLAVVRVLLKSGADPNTPTNYGVSLLHEAIMLDHSDVASALIENGADPRKPAQYMPADELLKQTKIRAETDPSLSYLPASYFVDHNVETPICLAARAKDSKIIKLLAEKGVDLNSHGVEGKTPLFIALNNLEGAWPSPWTEKATQPILQSIETLLDKKADPNAPNADGRSALFAFVGMKGDRSTQMKVIKELLGRGANINTVDQRGVSLLQAAIAADDIALAKKLLDMGANPNIQDQDGNSPLSVTKKLCSSTSYGAQGRGREMLETLKCAIKAHDEIKLKAEAASLGANLTGLVVVGNTSAPPSYAPSGSRALGADGRNR